MVGNIGDSCDFYAELYRESKTNASASRHSFVIFVSKAQDMFWPLVTSLNLLEVTIRSPRSRNWRVGHRRGQQTGSYRCVHVIDANRTRRSRGLTMEFISRH